MPPSNKSRSDAKPNAQEIDGNGGMGPIMEAFGIDPHKLYPIEHVSQMLSVDRKLVRWWIKKGAIEGIRLPNRAWRIRGIEIVRMLEDGRSRPK